MKRLALIIMTAVAVGMAGAARAQAFEDKPGLRGLDESRLSQLLGPSAHVRYIDCHNHLFAPGPEADYAGAVASATAAMDRLGIDKGLLMPPPFTSGQRGRSTAADFIGELRRSKGRLGFLDCGGSLNPMVQQSATALFLSADLKAKFEKEALAIVERGAAGFGELTTLHFSMSPEHPFEQAPPDHPLFLLLADIGAAHGMPLDIHMEAVPEDMPLPGHPRLQAMANPKQLKANLPAFERLLAHNRNAKIIWAHVGWCNTGQRTAALCAELLAKHSNLYMSFKLAPDSRSDLKPLDENYHLRPEWLDLIRAFPERFIIGTDQFYTPAGGRAMGPQKTGETKVLISLLPEPLAVKVGQENPGALFRLGPE